MLQIREVCKEYRTGDLVQRALDHVSLNLRDNEFVAILGPSGSGKTTLLNVIGGLDRYDSGDLIINGVSTKKYKDRDWDSYRNHTIGFVFQSYNLIPHQTILANVELALTISGMGKTERTRKAVQALEQVGLGEQVHKKPNQLSGGQMQRVAIARALVNDPDILLADEPTGALDSDTSIQVMDLLREVAKDRLVVMVTHNPELAEAYATRIVRLRDGKIQADTDPFLVDEAGLKKPEHRNLGKASMSFITSLSLSFNNLRTKKARTILTSFAGSIGIIGIALILSISNGVNDYIDTMEEETLAQYPLQIESSGFDFMSMMGEMPGMEEEEEKSGDIDVIETITGIFSNVDSNDLQSLKEYLDSGQSGIEDYTNSVEYKYDVTPQIFREDPDGVRQVNPDMAFEELGGATGSSSMFLSMMGSDSFFEMPEDPALYQSQYEVKAGRWPQNYNECVVVLTQSGGISDTMLYTLGLRDSMELDEMIRQYLDEETVQLPEDFGSYSYEDLLDIGFRLVDSADYYEYDSQYGIWTDRSDDEAYLQELVKNGEELTVVGVVQPEEGSTITVLGSGIGYLPSLTRHVMERAAEKEIVQNQIAHPQVDVFSGEEFGAENAENGFDLNSLFTVDTQALQEAFQFDESALTEGMSGQMEMPDLAGAGGLDLADFIDFGSLDLDLPQMSAGGLAELLGDIRLNVSGEAVSQMASGLLDGYQEYAAAHPEADFSRLGESFLGYLETEEAQNIFRDAIREIIRENADAMVTGEQLQDLMARIMTGYQEYAAEHGYTDPDRFAEYLMEYLQTADAETVMDQWAQENLGGLGDITISREQMEQLAGDMLAGYRGYAEANGLPDISRMGDYFTDYLGTPQAQQLLAAGIAGMVDTDSLQAQLADAMGSYMNEMMGQYGASVGQAIENQMASVMEQMMTQISAGIQQYMQQAMAQLAQNLGGAMNLSPEAFEQAFQVNMDGEELAQILLSMGSIQDATYEGNLQSLGYADTDVPSEIDIYPKDFESKEQVTAILEDYNRQMEEQGKEDQVISYTDSVGTLMSSVTDIVNVISYVLIAFVAISLLVSSIMIGVITYISVLERKKEIGILRAIGASKKNVSQVFNAETFIIGACAGILGIAITLILLIPGNMILHSLDGLEDITAKLPVYDALLLIGISILLTLIGGLIPSRKASKSDPVTALRVD